MTSPYWMLMEQIIKHSEDPGSHMPAIARPTLDAASDSAKNPWPAFLEICCPETPQHLAPAIGKFPFFLEQTENFLLL